MTTETQESTIIKFEDIQKGDHLKVKYLYPNSKTVETIEGIATIKREYSEKTKIWYTEEPHEKTLVYNRSLEQNAIIELLHRPVKEFPQDIGSVIKAKKLRGESGDFLLLRTAPVDDYDDQPWIVTEASHGYYSWVSEAEIEDWVEMTLTEKENS